MAKHNAPQPKTKKADEKPQPRAADGPPSHAREVRAAVQNEVWRAVGGSDVRGGSDQATLAQVLAIASGGLDFDPVLDGLLGIADELETLSVATEAKDDLFRLDLGRVLHRLGNRVEAFAELHRRMMKTTFDHVERLATEATA